MTRPRKTLDALLSGRRDANIRFDDLRSLLSRLGFDEHVKGDHFIFTHDRAREIINLQPNRHGQAKPYQVKQVRSIVTKYKMGLDA